MNSLHSSTQPPLLVPLAVGHPTPALLLPLPMLLRYLQLKQMVSLLRTLHLLAGSSPVLTLPPRAMVQLVELTAGQRLHKAPPSPNPTLCSTPSLSSFPPALLPSPTWRPAGCLSSSTPVRVTPPRFTAAQDRGTRRAGRQVSMPPAWGSGTHGGLNALHFRSGARENLMWSQLDEWSGLCLYQILQDRSIVIPTFTIVMVTHQASAPYT